MTPTFLDVDKWNEHRIRTGESLHVYLDGEDVTSRCFRSIFHADLMAGDVWLFKLDAEGRKYIDRETGKAATELRTGRLEIKPGRPLL